MPVLERMEQYAKETDDVGLLLVDLVAKIKSGTPLAELVALEFPNFVNAIQGATDIPGEITGNQGVALRTIGARMGELTEVLMSPTVKPVAAPELPAAPETPAA